MDHHDEPHGAEPMETTKGAIAWMSRNSVAANLLMLVVILAGVSGIFRTKQEVFPTFDLDIVSVHVPYPGASPAEVEQGIVLAVEEELRGIDGVKRVTATAGEGFGQIRAELLLGTNKEKILSDVKTAVDRISTLPEDAEEPDVTLISGRQQVISMVISGDQDARTLHELAEQARERLLSSPNITQVDLQGVRPLEISIEVSQEALESYGLTLEQIAAQVRASSIELPGGALKTEGGDLLIRVADRRLEGHQFGDLLIRGTADGSEVRLSEIATITDGYADQDLYSFYNGDPAVRIVAFRIGDETPQAVSSSVRELRDQLRTELPENISLHIWDDDSELLADRIDLLMRNARLGMLLVLLVLTAFLDLRLAFWVGLGIPISILGAFSLMPTADVSVNMVSLFAFIVTLGMVVDDAIVVGENIYDHEKSGMSRAEAAVIGAREMIMPVSFSILTTIVAFSPLLGVPGVMGKIFRILPVLVILVLLFSWLESFFVLPAHLAHSYDWLMRLLPPLRWLNQLTDRIRAPIERGLIRFQTGLYSPLLVRLVRYRYASLASGMAAFVLTVGIVASGMVPFSFFPKLEGDQVTASARLPYGTPVERTQLVQTALEQSAREAIEAAGGEAVFEGMYTTLGAGPAQHNGLRETGAQLVTVEIQLVPTSERELSSKEFMDLWSSATPVIAGLESLVFSSSVGPGAGAAVDVMLSHPDTTVLEAASNDMMQTLRTYPSLTDFENSFASGKPQLDFHLLPAAATLGLTANDVARQLRSAYFGAEALREQRGRNELKVMVRLPEAQRRSEYHLERLQIRTPAGGMVPLSHIASFERGRAPTTINREDGRRIVNIKAELTSSAVSSRDVLESLQSEVFPELRERYSGLQIDLAGEQREQGEAFASLGLNFLLAMVVMFALLAIPFRSYVQPILVMCAIPMGFVGAVGGHLLMGYSLSIISMFGIVALAGVVVNDSLVLIDATNSFRRRGDTAIEAALHGGVRRLRPILLTSLTTFFGLAPMILETSVQARFLIPMAISLGFGVLFATIAILLLVPPLYVIVDDITTFLTRAVGIEEGDPHAG
ncbi:MAG TPA: efflux RND transporter permease subunit [Deltaproteobacteria bacterium]|nr:efflux RND transporter permease subunit [Deltaproteobacteria bacterium]